MDHVYRKRAEYFKSLANQVDLYDRNRNALYEIAVDFYERIDYKTPQDRRSGANLYQNIGCFYFNKKDYYNASECFNMAAKYIHAINDIRFTYCTDDDYRELICCYLNLADSLIDLHKPEAACVANNNALAAFSRIHRKNREELVIEKANDNFVSFRAHYEKNWSNPIYLNSVRYKNNERVIQDVYTDKQMETLMGDMTVDASDEEASNARLRPQFTPIPVTPVLTDHDYRESAQRFYAIGSRYYTQGNIIESRKALKNAAEAISCIAKREQEDGALESTINQYLSDLEKRIEAQRNPVGSITQSLSGLSMFASSSAGAPASASTSRALPSSGFTH